MEKLSRYKVLKNIFVEGLGEFRKGYIASLSEDERSMFPLFSLEHEGDYLQGFDSEDKPVKHEWGNAIKRTPNVKKKASKKGKTYKPRGDVIPDSDIYEDDEGGK